MTEDHRVAVITGANSFLGVSMAERLIKQAPSETRLTIVVTSRTLPGVKEAVDKIKEKAAKITRKGPVEFDYLVFDQCNMISMKGAAYELLKRFKHIDYLFLNSCYAQFQGIDYLQATVEFFKSPIEAFTIGSFKKQGVGKRSHDDMGAVFQANVLSPWYLINEIIPLLKNGGRVIWISSCIAVPDYFDAEDLEMIQCPKSYETSKYQIELLHKATFQDLYNKHGIQQWMIQPGVFKSSSFVPTLNMFLYVSMFIMFYVCRFMGSPYHAIWPEVAANAPVWAALDADPEKDDVRIKYGSSTNCTGKEKLMETKMDYLVPASVSSVYEYVEKKRLEWTDRLKDQIIERNLY